MMMMMITMITINRLNSQEFEALFSGWQKLLLVVHNFSSQWTCPKLDMTKSSQSKNDIHGNNDNLLCRWWTIFICVWLSRTSAGVDSIQQLPQFEFEIHWNTWIDLLWFFKGLFELWSRPIFLLVLWVGGSEFGIPFRVKLCKIRLHCQVAVWWVSCIELQELYSVT